MLCPKSPGGLHYNCSTVQNVRHSKKDWVINPHVYCKREGNYVQTD